MNFSGQGSDLEQHRGKIIRKFKLFPINGSCLLRKVGTLHGAYKSFEGI